jgi:hypothetical protein
MDGCVCRRLIIKAEWMEEIILKISKACKKESRRQSDDSMRLLHIYSQRQQQQQDEEDEVYLL